MLFFGARYFFEGACIIEGFEIIYTFARCLQIIRHNLHEVLGQTLGEMNSILYQLIEGGLSVYVYVDIGIEVAAAVTRQSVERLKLFKGMEVAVTFKATAVQVFV